MKIDENAVFSQGPDLIPEVVCDRMLCDPEGKWHHQYRFKIGDKDWGVSKELPEELVASAMMEQKWIPVTERLPDTKTAVLVYTEMEFTEAARYSGAPGLWLTTWNGDDLAKNSVTHWMPLPEPPKP